RSKIHQGSGAEMSSRIWRSERHAKRLRNGLRILCHYAVMTCDTPGWQARNNSDIGTGLATTLTSSVWLRVPNICFMRVRFSSHTRPIPNTHGAWLVASPSQTPCDTSFISSKKHVAKFSQVPRNVVHSRWLRLIQKSRRSLVQSPPSQFLHHASVVNLFAQAQRLAIQGLPLYARGMKNPDTPVLDRLHDPVAEILTPQVARKLVRLRFDSAAQAKIDHLARKCNEGELTEAERREYESYVHAIDFVAILQAKARALLKRSANIE